MDLSAQDRTMLLIAGFCIVMAMLAVTCSLFGVYGVEQTRQKWVATEAAYSTRIYSYEATIKAYSVTLSPTAGGQ